MMALRDVSLIYVFLSCAFVKEALSCNGYTLKLNKLNNCGKNNVIQMDEKFTVDLDKNCNIIPKGCGTITKPFNTASLKYLVIKPPLPPIEGIVDACHVIEERQSIAAIMNAFALPTKCPVKAGKICVNGDKTFNISKFRTQLGIAAGNIKIKLQAKHDTGTTCVQIDLSLMRK